MLDTLISEREYLSTAYHPDVDFVDGHIEERNVGEREHGELQWRVSYLLKRQRFAAYIETRLKVSATRYRIPDICAYAERQTDSVLKNPPLLCIEVLSPEDRIHRTARVAEDYLAMGVATVWLLDPLERKAYVVDAIHGLHEVKENIAAADGRITFTLEEIFSSEDVFC